MAHETASGAALSVSAAAPATYDSTGYAALTWSNAAEVTNIGEVGAQMYNLVTHNPLATRAAKKSKGNYTNGSLSPSAAFDAADAGQVIIEAAVSSDSPISVKVELSSGRIYYFEALVMSAPVTVGESESVVMITPTLEVTHNPIVVV